MQEEKLTMKQETFISELLKGASQREAYKKAYNAKKMKDETIDTEACLLFNNPKVSKRFNELKDKLLEAEILTAKERMKFLSDVVKKDECTNYSDKMKAIDILNKMTGEYTQKVELDNSNLEVTIKVIE